MTAGWMRTLTPLGWIAVLVAAAGLAVSLLGGVGFRWDPLGLEARRLEAAEARAAAGAREAEARRIEADGAVSQMHRLDDFHQQTTAAAAVTARVVEQARNADDSDTLLETNRAARLGGHDRELCRLAPDLDGCAAAPDPARGGDAAVRSNDPAG